MKPYLKIVPPQPPKEGGPNIAFGTKVVLVNEDESETELPWVRDVKVHFPVDDFVSCRLELMGVQMPAEIMAKLEQAHVQNYMAVDPAAPAIHFTGDVDTNPYPPENFELKAGGVGTVGPAPKLLEAVRNIVSAYRADENDWTKLRDRILEAEELINEG